MEIGNAVTQVFDAGYGRLVTQLYAICGDQAEAEDAVQEAFVKALRLGRKFDELDRPEAWLRTVALNHLRNRWRHTVLARRLGPRVPGPARTVEPGPDHVALLAALDRLTPELRRVVALHYVADLPIAAIAAELGIPAGTVKSRLAKARDLLRPDLSDREEADHV